MPLARGTAACGYTALLSLFWAAGMPVTSSIPKDYQVTRSWRAKHVSRLQLAVLCI
jgi:hypothetical protein